MLRISLVTGLLAVGAVEWKFLSRSAIARLGPVCPRPAGTLGVHAGIEPFLVLIIAMRLILVAAFVVVVHCHTFC
jgi:hypothetical protein